MSKNKNKKTFAIGLDSLFGDDNTAKVYESAPKEEPKTTVKKTKKTGSKKSFSSGLDLFFQDAVEEVVKEAQNNVKDGGSAVKRRTKPDFGLDSLIRSTIETAHMEEKAKKKRISFTFDENRIDELKQIAAQEKARVRDIVGELIAEYIEKRKAEEES